MDDWIWISGWKEKERRKWDEMGLPGVKVKVWDDRKSSCCPGIWTFSSI